MTKRLAAFVLLALVGLSATAHAQAEDIETESITEQGTLDPFVAADSALQPIFEEAERLFRSIEQPGSIPLFDRLIARLESDHAAQPLPADLLTMLIQSRSHRAEANFNLGNNDEAAQDLQRILELDPAWEVDPDLVSPKFVEMLDDLRRERVGELLVLVDPIDARVTLDSQEVAFVGQPSAVLAGSRNMVIRRPGHEQVEEVVEIKAGRSMTVDHVLERVSAVARIRVRPAGAEILIDGAPAQVAERRLLEGEQPEEDLAIDGLTLGAHVLEIRLADYRPYRVRVEAPELDDYRLSPALLELMQGEIRLSELPEGATVDVDGERVELSVRGDGAVGVSVPPGDHVVEVRKSGVGGFRERTSVGDQEIVELLVQLRPTIAFLGVLGSDRLAATDLSEKLSTRFGRLTEWIWSDHSIDAPAVLDREGLNAAEFRRLAGLASMRSAPDWPNVQKAYDKEFAASLYMLAVLGDDLYATSADLWLWSPAPWPAAPDRRTLALQDGGSDLERLATAFDTALVPSYPSLGARFIDSVSGGPVATTVVPGSPAAAAGLAIGERVLAVSGQPVASASDLYDRCAALAGKDAVLTVGSGDNPREIRLPISLLPGVIDLADTGIVDQVLAARLGNELLRDHPAAPHWLLQLNQAALYLRALAYQEAVPLLRTIEAPEGGGLGRAMVDYWLGSTLLSVDARVYGEAARSALERALQQDGARLYHADGPLLAPRARARLDQLERLIRN